MWSTTTYASTTHMGGGWMCSRRGYVVVDQFTVCIHLSKICRGSSTTSVQLQNLKNLDLFPTIHHRIKPCRHSYLDKEETETKSRIVYHHVFNASYAHDQLLDPRHPQPNVVRLRPPCE